MSAGRTGRARTAAGDADRHFPALLFDNPLRRLFGRPGRYDRYVPAGGVVADVGCGPGFYTFALARAAGPGGRVFAVDSDAKAIEAVRRRGEPAGAGRVTAGVSSAAQLGLIGDGSVDFLLADGLLCCVAAPDVDGAVAELHRVLKPTGTAYLGVCGARGNHITPARWQQILSGFTVLDQGRGRALSTRRWALVRPRPG